MPLVSYDSSDEDSEQECSDSEELPAAQTSKSTKATDESNEETTKETNLFSKLPAPKSSPSSQSSLPITSLNDIVVNKTATGPIKITVPSLKHYMEDEDSDEELKKSKRIKKSSTGTGLSALLPKPKNTVSITSKSLVPQSLTRPKPNIPPPKATNSTAKPSTTFKKNIVEDDSPQKMNFFFIEDKSDDNVKEVNNELVLNDYEFGPKPESSETNVYTAPRISEHEQYANYGTSNSNSATTSTNISPVDDITYKKLIASKFGEESAEEINIVDIDVSKHLSESKDWLKSISEEKEETYKGEQPSSTARRKHQITYLAFQAKQREVELKNQWATNRLTKTQTRAKYGF